MTTKWATRRDMMQVIVSNIPRMLRQLSDRSLSLSLSHVLQICTVKAALIV